MARLLLANICRQIQKYKLVILYFCIQKKKIIYVVIFDNTIRLVWMMEYFSVNNKKIATGVHYLSQNGRYFYYL